VEQVRLDFAWFADTSVDGLAPDIEVVVEDAEPDFGRFGAVPATFVTPRNVVHQSGNLTIIDYFGQAVSVLDRRGARLVVQGRDEHLVHEAAYHFVLSQAGAALEARGLIRLHSLGLVGHDGGVAVMLPSGGGKSTLALRALRDDGVRLLSEDSPLVDRRGQLHPFPLRIGVNVGEADYLPPGSVRSLRRMEFHPKLALEIDAFRDRVATGPAPLRHLVIGQRTLGPAGALQRLPRRAAVSTLVREAVVGVGVYQGMEFLLQRGLRDAVGQARPAATRVACCAAALRGATVWRLVLGRDRESNWRALRPLVSG
jgi:hypothetical protein